MRDWFKKKLSFYNEVVKRGDEKEEKELKEEISKDDSEVYEIQKKKSLKMKELHESLRLSEKGSEQMKEGDIFVRYDEKSGNYFCELNGKIREISLADILTDMEWGRNYFLDPKTVPLLLRKKYAITKQKAKINLLADRQIIVSELANERNDEFKKSAYRGIAENIENEEAGNLRSKGVIAEKIVLNLLRKLAIEKLPDLEIESADPHNDVMQKIDFFIARKNHIRGARVEEAKEQHIGIQFTINTKEENLKHKIDQANKAKRFAEGLVDDIVVVGLPLEMVDILYQVWKKNKEPGGPEKLLKESDRRKIIFGVLGGIYSEEELEKLF